MSAQRYNRGVESTRNRTKTQRGLEVAIFLLASVLGTYGLGNGLSGFYERGQEINLLWLAVTGVAFFVLFAQMGRVHDSWPRRPDPRAGAQPTVATEASAAAAAESESR